MADPARPRGVEVGHRIDFHRQQRVATIRDRLLIVAGDDLGCKAARRPLVVGQHAIASRLARPSGQLDARRDVLVDEVGHAGDRIAPVVQALHEPAAHRIRHTNKTTTGMRPRLALMDRASPSELLRWSRSAVADGPAFLANLQGILHSRTGAEPDGRRGRNRHGRAVTRIATLAARTLLRFEDDESGDGHRVACHKRFGD
jgi:hypothetical protein